MSSCCTPRTTTIVDTIVVVLVHPYKPTLLAVISRSALQRRACQPRPPPWNRCRLAVQLGYVCNQRNELESPILSACCFVRNIPTTQPNRIRVSLGTIILYGGVAQLIREFSSFFVSVVQLVGWLTANREVRGSTPRSNLSIPEINFSDLHSPSARSGL